MDDIRRDVRQAMRSLARSPLFSVIAVGTLALGIGVGTTIFTLVNAVLLRPLPVERPSELVNVYTRWQGEPWATSSLPDYLDLRDGASGLSGLMGHANALAQVDLGGEARVLLGELITGNGFEVLGVRAEHGRLLVPEDDRDPGQARVAVLGHALWTRELGADPAVVGTTLRINGQPYQVVGIAPEGYSGLMPGLVAEFWVPAVRVDEIDAAGQINATPNDPGTTLRERRGYRWLWIKGRLAPETTLAEAEARLAATMARLATDHPLTNEGRTAAVQPTREVRYHPEVDRALGPVAGLLLGAVALLLLVVCANLANLVLSRGEGRRRELATRLALGAGRGRVVRQLLLESLVVGLLGSAGGLLASLWATRLLLAFQPPVPFAVGLDAGADLRVVGFAVGVALVSAVGFGLLPALRSSRRDLVTDLRQGSRSSDGPAGRWSVRNALVVSQVGLCMVLLVAAALLARGLAAARDLDVGLDPDSVAAVGMNLGMQGYDEASGFRLAERLRDRAAALPGVSAAALATRVPFDVNITFTNVFPDAAEASPGAEGIPVDATWVDASYFETVGVTLERGRGFDSRDREGSPRVAIVNRTMARRFWGGETVVGRTFRTGAADGERVEIVGVVADHKVRTVGEEPRPLVHFALPQRPAGGLYLLARAVSGDAAALVPDLRRSALELDSGLAFTETTTLGGFRDVSLFPVRMGARLLGAFGLLALLLAAGGLYGVIAYSVARRRREIGIRLALGARPVEVIRGVMAHGLRLVVIGAAIGAACAVAAGTALSGALYGVSAVDPAAYAAGALLLGAVVGLANLLPAWRASRTDPVTVLKDE